MRDQPIILSGGDIVISENKIFYRNVVPEESEEKSFESASHSEEEPQNESGLPSIQADPNA